ncbi:hypothetical protein J6590_034942 [Homalodisca vitripennis]|nr:hypothetical protein J6590_034942 [Homalodisca vitripennis]
MLRLLSMRLLTRVWLFAGSLSLISLLILGRCGIQESSSVSGKGEPVSNTAAYISLLEQREEENRAEVARLTEEIRGLKLQLLQFQAQDMELWGGMARLTEEFRGLKLQLLQFQAQDMELWGGMARLTEEIRGLSCSCFNFRLKIWVSVWLGVVIFISIGVHRVRGGVARLTEEIRGLKLQLLQFQAQDMGECLSYGGGMARLTEEIRGLKLQLLQFQAQDMGECPVRVMGWRVDGGDPGPEAAAVNFRLKIWVSVRLGLAIFISIGVHRVRGGARLTEEIRGLKLQLLQFQAQDMGECLGGVARLTEEIRGLKLQLLQFQAQDMELGGWRVDGGDPGPKLLLLNSRLKIWVSVWLGVVIFISIGVHRVRGGVARLTEEIRGLKLQLLQFQAQDMGECLVRVRGGVARLTEEIRGLKLQLLQFQAQDMELGGGVARLTEEIRGLKLQLLQFQAQDMGECLVRVRGGGGEVDGGDTGPEAAAASFQAQDMELGVARLTEEIRGLKLLLLQFQAQDMELGGGGGEVDGGDTGPEAAAVQFRLKIWVSVVRCELGGRVARLTEEIRGLKLQLLQFQAQDMELGGRVASLTEEIRGLKLLLRQFQAQDMSEYPVRFGDIYIYYSANISEEVARLTEGIRGLKLQLLQFQAQEMQPGDISNLPTARPHVHAGQVAS